MNLRELGRIRVLQALYDTTSTSRSELVRLTGLSRATVSSLVADLLATDLVVADGDDDSAEAPVRVGGRPVQPISLNPEAAYAAGADIGHEHVQVAICDLRGSLVWERHLQREVDRAPRETLDLVAELVLEGLKETGVGSRVLGLGIDIAAPVRSADESLAALGIMPGWVDVQPGPELSRRTGLSTRVVNDANAGALGEGLYGAGRNCSDFIYIRLSAGIGAGVVINGALLAGTDGLAGEIGHVVVDPHGWICRCGKRGCLETVASPVAIAHLLSSSWHEPVSVHDVMGLIEAGDRGAIRAMQDAAEEIGRVLAMLVTVLNPERIIVGGDLAGAAGVLFQPLSDSIRRHALPAAAGRVQVVAGELGANAEVLGAAGLILRQSPGILASRSATHSGPTVDTV